MFYLLYKTRNGQQLWEGPFASEQAAMNRAPMILGAQETGDWFVTNLSITY